jgi:hypothetical protein
MERAIAELERGIEVAETNMPINEREGNFEQAALEREVIRDFKAAIEKLKK